VFRNFGLFSHYIKRLDHYFNVLLSTEKHLMSRLVQLKNPSLACQNFRAYNVPTTKVPPPNRCQLSCRTMTRLSKDKKYAKSTWPTARF
jgi:hypothetical protein